MYVSAVQDVLVRRWQRKCWRPTMTAARGAIGQIKEKNYLKALDGYKGEIFFVGINYDKESKRHSCVIENYGA